MNEIDADPPFAERFTLLLDAFLTFSPVAAEQLRSQQIVVEKLRKINQLIRSKRDQGVNAVELNEYFTEQLHQLNRDCLARFGKVQSPLNPKIEVTQLKPENCKILSSKMAPLWLMFQNQDPRGPDVQVIFKVRLYISVCVCVYDD